MSNTSTPKNIIYVSGQAVYNVSPTDDIVNIDTSVSPVLVVLPNIGNAGLLLFRKQFFINDATGNASVNNITIIAAGGIVNSGQLTVININSGSSIASIVDINEYQVSTDSQSGGGSNIYLGASPTTLAVGGIPVGSNIYGLTYDELWEDLLVPYISPTFTSFNMVGQTSPVEVGATITTPKTFSFGFSNANVLPNTLDIIDVNAGLPIATGLSLVSPTIPISIGSIQQTSPNSYSWRGKATNTQSIDFFSSIYTINWFWRKYFGTSALTTLNESDIEALINNPLSNTENGTYSFVALNYKYFCFPDSFGSPSAAPNGFVSGGFLVSMASVVDNAFYSNVQNGWYYGLVPVTNSFGFTTNYRVYRTLNTLGSAITITVN